MNMKFYVFISFLSFYLNHVGAQEFKKFNGESNEQFAERLRPNDSSEVVGKVIEVQSWIKHKNVVIAFYKVSQRVKTKTGYFVEIDVEGYLYFPTENNYYRRIFIDSYGEEGAIANVDAIAFANADKDKEKEMVILCSWNQDLHAAPISGNLYQISFYDTPKKNLSQLDKIDLSKYFPDEFDGTNDSGERSRAKFNTIKKIKARLSQIGY
jgi:hypothetical protein